MTPLHQRLLDWATEIEQDPPFNPPTIEAITQDLREAAARLTTEAFYQLALEWRNIETPCPTCGGAGVRAYANTATYNCAAIAGQAITTDVCDACWGSGDATRPWPSRLASR